MEEKCRYLSSFTLKTAEIELPGEFLLSKHTHYYVRISRFMPRVDIVQKYNTAARRLYIRGHNGKIYPYLLVNDSGLVDARREERVLQLLRMLNHYLGKQKVSVTKVLMMKVSADCTIFVVGLKLCSKRFGRQGFIKSCSILWDTSLVCKKNERESDRTRLRNWI